MARGKTQTAHPQGRGFPGQPTIQCLLKSWHDPHGYGKIIDCPEAVREGAGWCPGLSYEQAQRIEEDD